MNEKSYQSCPSCGTRLELNADSIADGLCPRCLLESSLYTTLAGQDKASPPASVEVVSAAFPDLEIIEIIGRGGMGAVYKARQKSLDRLVALKLLPLSLTSDQEFTKRFEAEAKALASMNHPNIVTVHEFGQQGDFYFLLMEYVDGPNLRNLLQDHRMTPEEALTIIPPVCQALEFAHQRNIVHCDIKPENLLLNTQGQVKIADFGIARILGQSTADNESEKAAGTPAYMAPEQMDSPHAVDTRADIYSLGVVFYEMLTGERPGKDFSPPSGKNTSVDIRLDKIVQRALAANPELRWQSANALNCELQTILTQKLGEPKVTPPKKLPTSNRVLGWLAGTLGILAVVIYACGYLAHHHVTPLSESEHQAAIERGFEYSVDFYEGVQQENALRAEPNQTQAVKDEIEKLSEERSERATLGSRNSMLLRGLSESMLSNSSFALIQIICLFLGLVALVLGYRHLSWLRGQKEPLPAWFAAILGTLLYPLSFATVLILSAVHRLDSLLVNAFVLISILMLTVWSVRRLLAWARNLRNVPSFSTTLIFGLILLGFSIAIPYSAAQEGFNNTHITLSSSYRALDESRQDCFSYMLINQKFSDPAAMELARNKYEEYAQATRSYHELTERPFHLLLPGADALRMISIWSLLTLAIAIALIIKSRQHRS